MQFFIAFFVLFLVLLAQESLSDHQDRGWGMVVRSAVISVLWVIFTIATQEFGVIAWAIGIVLLVLVIRDVKGYSSITSAIFFVIVVSLTLQGILLLLAQFL